MSDFRVGDKVTVASPKYPGIWTITKVNPVNMSATQGDRRLTVHPSFCTKVTSEALVQSTPIPESFTIGEVVTLVGKPGFYVVIKDGFDKVNVALMGGDGGRYYRARPAQLTKVKGHFVKEG